MADAKVSAIFLASERSYSFLPAICGNRILLLIGLRCASVYPCLLHSTPQHFGAEHSQALVGLHAGLCAGTPVCCTKTPLYPKLSSIFRDSGCAQLREIIPAQGAQWNIR